MAANGRSSSLSNAVGGLYLPPTKRKKFETIWVDMIHPHPANQLFRKRALEFKDPSSVQAFVTQIGDATDDEGKLKDEIVKMMFDCFIHDWGGWETNEDGRKYAVPLYFDNGDECICTFENAKTIFREVDGGAHLFFALYDTIRNTAFFQVKQTEEEKNFLRLLPAPPSSETGKSTQSARKQARISKPRGPRKSTPRPTAKA